MAQPGRKRREDSPYGEQAQHLAAGLRSRREGAGMTQEQLAAQARVAVATVRKIESGSVTNPGIFTVIAMLSALGAAAEDIAVLAAMPRLELGCVTAQGIATQSRGMPRGTASPRNPALAMLGLELPQDAYLFSNDLMHAVAVEPGLGLSQGQRPGRGGRGQAQHRDAAALRRQPTARRGFDLQHTAARLGHGGGGPRR